MRKLLSLFGLATVWDVRELHDKVEDLEREIMLLTGELEEEDDEPSMTLMITPKQKYKQ